MLATSPHLTIMFISANISQDLFPSQILLPSPDLTTRATAASRGPNRDHEMMIERDKKEEPDLERRAVERVPPHPADANAHFPLERPLPAVEEAVHLLPHRLRRRPLPEQPPVQRLLHVLLCRPPRHVLHPRRHLRLRPLFLAAGVSGF